MKAICLRDNIELEVLTYKDIMYAETTSKNLPYKIFKLTNDRFDEIEYGMNYSYYYIKEVLYDSFLTNNYKPFAKETEQLELFDRRDYY